MRKLLLIGGAAALIALPATGLPPGRHGGVRVLLQPASPAAPK